MQLDGRWCAATTQGSCWLSRLSSLVCTEQHMLHITKHTWVCMPFSSFCTALPFFRHSDHGSGLQQSSTCRSPSHNSISSLIRMQDTQDECGRVAQDLRMQVPAQVSSQTDDSSPVYTTLVAAALAPIKFIPETPTLRVSESDIHLLISPFLYVCRPCLRNAPNAAHAQNITSITHAI